MVRSRSFVSLLLVFLLPSASASFDCKFDITTHHFDLTSLKGVHTTSKTDDTPPTITNTTIFIDLCQDIQWDKEKYPVDDRCEDGTQGIHSQELFSNRSLCDKVHGTRRREDCKSDNSCCRNIFRSFSGCKDDTPTPSIL
jgi:hypothetical protein